MVKLLRCVTHLFMSTLLTSVLWKKIFITLVRRSESETDGSIIFHGRLLYGQSKFSQVRESDLAVYVVAKGLDRDSDQFQPRAFAGMVRLVLFWSGTIWRNHPKQHLLVPSGQISRRPIPHATSTCHNINKQQFLSQNIQVHLNLSSLLSMLDMSHLAI
jgi:hypothetical protein